MVPHCEDTRCLVVLTGVDDLNVDDDGKGHGEGNDGALGWECDGASDDEVGSRSDGEIAWEQRWSGEDSVRKYGGDGCRDGRGDLVRRRG